jgi:hypothetical protein
MEEQIVAYLEQYGQPQSLDAICEHALGQEQPDRTGVKDVLEQMVAAGTIQQIEAGVHANGNAAIEYAPLSYQAEPA